MDVSRDGRDQAGGARVARAPGSRRPVLAVVLVALLALVAFATAAGPGCGDGQSEASKNATEKFTEILGRAPAADSVAADVAKSGTLIVAVDGDYPPQSSIDPETKEPKGFDVDVARELATRLGLKIEFVNPNWDAIAAGLKTGRFHAAFSSIPITAAAKPAETFTAPYAYLTAIPVSPAKGAKITSAADLKGMTVAAPALSAYAAFLQGLGGVQVKVYPTDVGAIPDLREGIVDALLTSETDAAAIVVTEKTMRAGDTPIFYQPLGGALRKGETDLTTIFDKTLGEMRDDGTLSKISKDWYAGRDVTVPPPEGVPEYTGAAK
jgi:ABC-type amino acid transport substrate-binding protein